MYGINIDQVVFFKMVVFEKFLEKSWKVLVKKFYEVYLTWDSNVACQRPASLLKMISFEHISKDFAVFKDFLQFLDIGKTHTGITLDDCICM